METIIRETIERFLADWDRHAWMQQHGDWASEDWDDDREAYEKARDRLEVAIGFDAKDVDRRDGLDLDEAREAFDAFIAAASALTNQVRPGEGDFIAEGIIDPDGLEDRATELNVASASWQGWNCREGWCAYRIGDDLVVNWYRVAWGHRRSRDLWVMVEPGYFSAEEDAA